MHRPWAFPLICTPILMAAACRAGTQTPEAVSARVPPAIHAGEDAGVLPTWFTEPVQRDRHTTLLARFDGASDKVLADYARTQPGASGKNYRAPVEGKIGNGVETDGIEAQINFRGDGNLNPMRGTIQFWLRSKQGKNIWNDNRMHWLLSARAIGGDLQLGKDRENRLCWEWGLKELISFRPEHGLAPGPTSPVALAVPVGDLKPEDWHHIAVSWDAAEGRLWLAVDGRLRTLSLGRPMQTDDFYLLFLGSHHEAGYEQTAGRDTEADWLLSSAGGTFDELKVSDTTIPEIVRLRTAEVFISDDLATRVQDAVRRNLDLMMRLQVDGAWGTPVYAWPHLVPGGTSYRTFFHPDRTVTYHGRNGTPGAGMYFVYAYQVLGDRSYLEAAERAGDWLLAAQQPEGYWAGAYRRQNASPPAPVGSVSQAAVRPWVPAMYDGAQSQPAILLAQLYRETGDARWLAGFKKSSEFLLKAQNPNGSWSHNYNVRTGHGETRGDDLEHPYVDAGDFSNGIMHAQMTIMLIAHRLTGERKYLDALKRAGEWTLAAQMGPPTYGWASHYNAANQPVWGRNWEPPAMSGVGAEDLALFMYDVTGERKYVDAARKYLQWEKGGATVRFAAAGGKVIEGRSHYTDPRTGRPIKAANRKVYFVDRAEDRAVLLRDTWVNPQGLSDADYRWLGPVEWRGLASRVNERSGGSGPRPVKLSRNELAESLPALKKEAEDLVATQNAAGVWPMIDDRTGGIGEFIVLVDYKAERLLSLIERSRMLSGELKRDIWVYPSPLPYCHGLPAFTRENWMDFPRQ